MTELTDRERNFLLLAVDCLVKQTGVQHLDMATRVLAKLNPKPQEPPKKEGDKNAS